MEIKWLLLGLSLVGLSGCASQPTVRPVRASSAASSTKTSHRHSTSTAIQVTIAGHRLKAHLNRSQPAKQLRRQLPATFRFNGMGAGDPEKTSDLKQALRVKHTPNGADPHPGDIAYWSPQPRLAFYWGGCGDLSRNSRVGSF
ncbi:hypothetical protein IV54_GL002110 [Levilactobacillus paucivorans]|uniref:Cyclophilin-like domain-containing protein n=1 Tax=Levilactobacillus paucivorans TaxID=616990 RepID=A0A0R2LPP4_9LACO|nr:cyclophilin-like fold protein [Levilactobacillus paucivorans]KRO03749.1 hypothetical protein IV54_GL002110 [Levilactobacillus paucivorans]